MKNCETYLQRAEYHHNEAKKLYRSYLLLQVTEAGGVANLAARTGIPVKMLHSSLDENCNYSKQRNMAFEIVSKME